MAQPVKKKPDEWREVLDHMGLPISDDGIMSFTEKFITDISEKGGNQS